MMSKLIVPPPILLASRIAWRNEPEPLSLVFVTVKTRGVMTLFARVDRAVERVVLNALATPEARKTEAIENRATARAIRSANADMEVFRLFFILFSGVRFGGLWGG